MSHDGDDDDDNDDDDDDDDDDNDDADEDDEDVGSSQDFKLSKVENLKQWWRAFIPSNCWEFPRKFKHPVSRKCSTFLKRMFAAQTIEFASICVDFKKKKNGF